MLPSSSPTAAMPADWLIATASTGSSPSTKRSVSASWTVMSSVTPPPAPGAVDPPALQVRRQVDRVEHAREQRPADPAGLDRLAHGAVGGGVAQMVVGAHHHARRPAGRHHLAGVGQGHRQRLLAQHVLAGRGRRQRLREVQLVGGADVDDLDRRIGQQRLDAVVAARRCHSRRRRPGRAAASLLITATASPPWARIAPIMCSLAMVLAPIRPQPGFAVMSGGFRLGRPARRTRRGRSGGHRR